MSLRTRVEDAAIAALADLLAPGLGGAGDLKSIQPYAGDFRSPSPEDPEVAQLLSAGTPCVGIATGDGQYDDVRLRRLHADLDFTVELLVISGNARGAEERHRGDGLSADAGIYQLIEDVRDRLFVDDLGVAGAGSSTPVSESAVVRTASVTAWHLVYAISGDVFARQPDRLDEELTAIRTHVRYVRSDPVNPIVIADHELEAP